jgi:hypothetical protein
MTVPSTTRGVLARARNSFTASIRRGTIVGAVGLAGLAVSAPAAIAGKSQTIDTKGGHVEYHDDTEGLLVRDDRRDGYSVSAELALVDGLPLFDVVDGDGANNTPNFDRYPLPERTNVLVRMCYLQGQWKIVSCSKWQRAQA